MTRSRRRIEIGTPQPQDAPQGLTARPVGGKRWYFVKGHPRPVYLTGREPFIRTWPDGTPMVADGSRDTLRAADDRHASPAPVPAPEKEEEDDA